MRAKLITTLILLSYIVILHAQGDLKKEEALRWRFNLSGGGGYMIASSQNAQNAMVSNFKITQDAANSYFEGLKLGFQGGAEGHYLFHNSIMGLGLKYLYFGSSNSTDHIYTNTVVQLSNGTLSSKNHINFVGPSFFGRQSINENNTFYLYTAIALGYVHSRTETILEDDKSYYPQLITANTAGWNLDLGLEYFIAKNCALGVNASLFSSSFGKGNYNDGNTASTITFEDRENISRIDLSLGVRFYK